VLTPTRSVPQTQRHANWSNYGPRRSRPYQMDPAGAGFLPDQHQLTRMKLVHEHTSRKGKKSGRRRLTSSNRWLGFEALDTNAATS